MNKDILKGQWKELKGDIKQRWGKLTDDDLTQIDGSYEKLEGALQKTYGYQKDQAKKELDKYFNETETK